MDYIYFLFMAGMAFGAAIVILSIGASIPFLVVAAAYGTVKGALCALLEYRQKNESR